MGIRDRLDVLVKGLRQSNRRRWAEGGRAHIEVRPGGRSGDEVARRVESELRALPRVTWAEVNPHTGRVVVAFEPGAYTLDELTGVVERAEQAAGATLDFDRQTTEHPGDDSPVLRSALEAGASALGVVGAVALKMSPLPELGVGAMAASALTAVGMVPWLRRSLDEKLSPKGTDHVLRLVTPALYGSSGRVLAPLVELAQRLGEVSEAQARKRVWAEREGELCARPVGPDAITGERPHERPLPAGPVEQYTESAWQVALGAFGVNLVASGSVRRAASSLLVGLPKPARLGREAFASQLGRALAAQGILVMEPGALRRLDRVDCLVLQGDLVPRQRFSLGAVTAAVDGEATQARAQARSLFVAEEPLATRRAGEWALGPLPEVGAVPAARLAARARELGRSGALVLGLARGATLVAVVEVQIAAQIGIDELIAAARAAQMRVVIAGAPTGGHPSFEGDDVIEGGRRAAEGVRRLQAAGHVVCAIGTTGAMLAASDVGLGLRRAGQPPAWGAHLLGGEDLADARWLIEACVAARQASLQSVRVAAAAAAVGGFVSASGLIPMNTDRAMRLVNVTSLVTMGNGARVAYALAARPLPPPRDPTPWHALDPEGVLVRLNASATGLTTREAARRTRRAAASPALLELGRAIADEALNPLVPLLAAGAGMSAAVGSLVDAGLVAGVVGFNAVLGGVQRFRVGRAVQALERRALERVAVLRGGKWQQVDVATLVRGDVLVLQAGDIVPADCRLLDASSLEIDASSLTGESLPVRRSPAPSFEAAVADRTSVLYGGSIVVAGRATAVVVAVGAETEAERAGGPRTGGRPRPGVEARLGPLTAMAGPAAAAAGFGMLASGLLREQRIEQIVGSAVGLAVASVPEGLPLLATAAQLAAAERLSKRGALVRNPRALEALGRIDVLCVDKTGTMTEGRIALHRVSDGRRHEDLASLGFELRAVLQTALRASPERMPGAPQPEAVDEALARGARELGLGVGSLRRLGELAFAPGRGYHAVTGQIGDAAPELYVKGSPEALLPRSTTRLDAGGGVVPLDAAERARLEELVTRSATRGLRMLAVASRPVDAALASSPLTEDAIADLTFRGFLAFRDPVRPTAREAVATLRGAGVEVVMITGDHPGTAEAVASRLDLLDGGIVLTGPELDALDDEALRKQLPRVRVFARMTPAQKVRVVQALQRSGRVVAMAGDGANDAPAMRLADVGIALGQHAVAAARNAADLVLTDERIETLCDAVLEGRSLWTSTRDAVSMLVGGNLGEVAFSLIANLATGSSPLNARQLLLVNLLTDVAPAMAIALRPPSADVSAQLLRQGPEAALGSSLHRDVDLRAAATAAGAGMAFTVGKLLGDDDRARTMGMVSLVGTQLGQTLLSGHLSPGALVASVGSAALLAGVVQTPLVSQFFGCRPLRLVDWATCFGSSALATVGAARFDHTSDEIPWRFERARGPSTPRTSPEPDEL